MQHCTVRNKFRYSCLLIRQHRKEEHPAVLQEEAAEHPEEHREERPAEAMYPKKPERRPMKPPERYRMRQKLRLMKHPEQLMKQRLRMKPLEQHRMRQKLRPMKHPEQPMKQKLQTAAMQGKVKPEHRRMMPAIPPQTKQKPDPMKTPERPMKTSEQPMMTQRLRLMTAAKQRMIRRMQRLMIPAHLQRITDRMQEHLQKTMTVRIIPMTMRIPVKSLTAVLNSRIRLIHQISPTHRIRTAVPMIRQMTAQKKLQKLI